MSKELGFIQLHRRIRKHWIWEDSVKLKWWLDIVMECNHAPKKVLLGVKLVDCNRGQTVKSVSTWAKQWRVDVGVARRFLDLLKSDEMIVTENVVKSTRLTVCKYDDYNKSRRANDEQTNSKQTFRELSASKNKERIKNEKKEGNNGASPVSPADPFPLSKAPIPKPTQYK